MVLLNLHKRKKVAENFKEKIIFYSLSTCNIFINNNKNINKTVF